MRERVIRVAAPAKVNLHLGVGQLRSDGYHSLATVYHALALMDELELSVADGPSSVSMTGHGSDLGAVPTGDDNLVLRAAHLLAEHVGRDLPVHITLSKRIPVAGGLAGGSSDAAAALVGVERLYELGISRAELLELAGRLGSDVPFCLLGGTAVGSGRGELVESVPTAGEYGWVMVTDPVGLSTPAVYAEFDRLHADDAKPEPEPEPVVPHTLLEALRRGDPHQLGACLRNDLQPAALSLRPELAEVLAAGRAGTREVPGALGALVSGSGPTLVFLGADPRHVGQLARHLRGVVQGSGGRRVLIARSPVQGAHRQPVLPAAEPVPEPTR